MRTGDLVVASSVHGGASCPLQGHTARCVIAATKRLSLPTHSPQMIQGPENPCTPFRPPSFPPWPPPHLHDAWHAPLHNVLDCATILSALAGEALEDGTNLQGGEGGEGGKRRGGEEVQMWVFVGEWMNA